MRILEVLTYYRPHTSGLTIYVERLSRALVKRGHQVTVLTSRFDRSLPKTEIQDGVHVVRVPVLFRISKGCVMPAFGLWSTGMVLRHDVIHLHLPQFEAAGAALAGRLMRKPTVITYHCDLKLPPGIFNTLANPPINMMNHLAGTFVHKIVTNTRDFADHSVLLQRFAHKIYSIPPPVELPKASPEEVEAFARLHNPLRQFPVIGMAARLASEKGGEVLLNALPKILEKYPRALVLFAGQHENVMGEQEYHDRLMPVIRQYQARQIWKFLGVLDQNQMAAFYPNIDVLAVPSLNSTESFGLVQIEAMMNRVPVVASDLPGVRQPVLTTGMGLLIPRNHSEELARGINTILDQPEKYHRGNEAIHQLYAPETIASEYEELFEELSKTV